nr:ribonuclease H-like domain-containing protein [Tanacetum cinerariifolium]
MARKGVEILRFKFGLDSKTHDKHIGELDKMADEAENLSPQSTPQVLPSIKVYTLPVTYPKVVEDTIITPLEIEPLDHTKLEDLGLNTYSPDIFVSSREVCRGDEPEPQPLPNFPSLDVIFDKESSKVLRIFTWTILGGRFSQFILFLLHYCAKLGEY